ncbi:hypothetical protein KEM54_002866 [Ascosphaera aggregata]|nr:hypothetical protein KEM54_002866 [Ascosphaera aggregata]
MESSSNSSDTDAEKDKAEPWLIPLNRKIDMMAFDTLEGNFRRSLAITIRDLLLKTITPAQAAAQIDIYRTDEFVSVLHSRPNRLGGVFTFRSTVDRAICHISTVVTWRGTKQDLLVELLLELRKLGDRWVKVNGKDHLVDFRNDLALTDTMDEFHYAYDPFTARCLQAGIHEVFPPFPDNAYNHFWYAQNVLNRNLNIPNYEENNRRLTERRRMGAALYIIFAGKACFEHLVLDEAVRGKGKRLWPLWMKVFEEIVEGTGDCEIMKPRIGDTERDRKVLQEVRELSMQALEKMKVLWKALEKEEKDSAFEASYGNGYRQYHDSYDRHDTVH